MCVKGVMRGLQIINAASVTKTYHVYVCLHALCPASFKPELHLMFPCPHPCLSSVPISVILNYTLQQFFVRYLMILTSCGDIIYKISENHVSMRFSSSMSVIDGRRYLDTNRCSLPSASEWFASIN